MPAAILHAESWIAGDANYVLQYHSENLNLSIKNFGEIQIFLLLPLLMLNKV